MEVLYKKIKNELKSAKNSNNNIQDNISGLSREGQDIKSRIIINSDLPDKIRNSELFARAYSIYGRARRRQAASII